MRLARNLDFIRVKAHSFAMKIHLRRSPVPAVLGPVVISWNLVKTVDLAYPNRPKQGA